MTHIHRKDALVREVQQDNGDYVIYLNVPKEIVPTSPKYQWTLPVGSGSKYTGALTVEGARRMAMEMLAACDRAQKTTTPQLKRRK